MTKVPELLEPAAPVFPAQASVLLVDEFPASLASWREILAAADYDLKEACSGEDALERLKAQEFAVVLLSVRTPGFGGFATAKLIRADERCRHIPIIFLSADDVDRTELEAGYSLGAIDFLVQPLSPVVAQAKLRGFARLYEEKRRAKTEADQLRMLVQGTNDYAIFMLDPNGLVLTWNTGAERIKQYQSTEIIGQHFSKFYPPSAIARNWPEHELKVASAEGRFEDEGWRLRKDGSRFWANVVITALRDEQGKLLGYSKVTRDLTERKQAEESLRRSEERFRHMVESMHDYAIFMLDPQGQVVSWNAGAQRLKGYRADEIIGQHFSRFYPQEALDRGWPAHELRIATAEGRFEDEGWRVRKDGSQFWANVVVTALQDERGNLFGFSKITRDLTARKQAEENARRLAEEAAARQVTQEERERLRVTLASIGDGVISTDAEGHVTFLNPVAEALVGWTTDEAVGHSLENVFCIVNETTRQPVENPALRALRDGKIVGLANHTVLISKDGSEHPIDDSAAPICDGKGRIVGAVLVFRDISERKRIEQEQQELHRQIVTTLESISDGFMRLDPDWRILYVNAEAERINSRSREEMLGKSYWELFPATFGTSLAAEFRRAMADRVTVELESYYEPWCRWFAIKGYPSPDGCLAIYFRDITEHKQAEDAVRRAEEQLRNITDTVPALISYVDAEFRYLLNNRAYELWFGRPRSQITGRHMRDVLGEDAWSVVGPKVQAALAGQTIHYVSQVVYQNAGLRWVEATYVPSHGAEGEVVGVVVMVNDITERKVAEEALALSEERLRLALDAGRMGVWDWNIRTGDLKWSDSLEPLHGLAPGTFGGTFDHFQQLIHPEDRETVNAAIRQALDTGGEFYVEFRNVWPSGGTHWIAGSGKVFFGDDGQPLRLIGIGLDVTRRKRAEQTSCFLADASAALAVLVDFDSTLQKVASLAVPSFADWATVDVTEADGSLRRVSVSHIDPAKVQLAHDVHRRFPPDPTAPQGVWNILRTDRSEIIPEITDELLEQSVKDDELLGIMRELGLKSYIGVPLIVRGKTLAVITFINAESGHRYDTTDLAVAEDLASRAAIAIENAQLYRELRDADQRKDEFLATLAHELRNPLAPLRNGLQVLRLSGSSGGLADEARSMMERQLSQMVRLVDDLLDVSRITRNKLALKKQRVELAAVVQSAIETSRPLIEQSGHEFTLTLPPAPIYLDADLARLAQVFSNLLNNAAKYTEPGGTISLVGEVDGGEIVVRVSDNGLGIPAESLPQIFQMFSQVDRNLERAQGGLGIGLTLVRRLVEMHDGQVEAYSDGPGWGSQFVVRLPVIKATQQAAPSQAEDDVSTTAKRRILVVDDNRDSATSLSMMLTLMGNETQTAYDGLAALEVAEMFRPDVILLDIGLPKLNGYDACRRIREQAWSKGIVIVALTGWGQEEDRRRSQDAGFDHHLVKPVDPTDLSRLLAEKRS